MQATTQKQQNEEYSRIPFSGLGFSLKSVVAYEADTSLRHSHKKASSQSAPRTMPAV